MNRTLRIFWQFSKRDFYVYSKRAKTYIINETIIRPLLFGLAFGYLLPNLSVMRTMSSSAIFFVGTVLYVFTSLSSSLVTDFWIDLDSTRHCSYQIAMISPIAYLLQKIVCGSVIIFLCVMPIYPAAQLLLGNPFPQLTFIRFPLLLFFLLCASLLMMTFTFAALMFVQHLGQMRIFWRRVMHILANLGGAVVPFGAIIKVVPLVGYINYSNPLSYVTEGLRQVLIGGPQFFNFSTSVLGVTCSFIFFVMIAHYKLGQRLDPVG